MQYVEWTVFFLCDIWYSNINSCIERHNVFCSGSGQKLWVLGKPVQHRPTWLQHCYQPCMIALVLYFWGSDHEGCLFFTNHGLANLKPILYFLRMRWEAHFDATGQGCFCSECFAGVEHISTDVKYSLRIAFAFAGSIFRALQLWCCKRKVLIMCVCLPQLLYDFLIKCLSFVCLFLFFT